MLYEVAMIEQPTKKDKEEGASEKLILKPTAVIANDDKQAAIAAVMQHKDDIGALDMSRLQVIVRPFC